MSTVTSKGTVKTKKRKYENWVCVIIVGILAIICFLPMWISTIASFTPEEEVTSNGYVLFPKELTVDTYRYIFMLKGKMILRAYGVSITQTVLGTFYSMAMMLMYAYAIYQKPEVFPPARFLSFFAWLTTILSGGILPWYILCTQYYGLKNNLWALFIPHGINVFNMFILRNSYRSIPEELIEAAKIDGASNLKIFLMIALPLSKVGITTVILFTAIGFWNDYYLNLYLISYNRLYNLQRLLYQVTASVQNLLMGNEQFQMVSDRFVPPTNTAKMAVMVLAVTPILFVYPWAQKYFVRGITVGAVKG